MSVTVPTVVPFTITDAPITGPVSSKTRPERVLPSCITTGEMSSIIPFAYPSPAIQANDKENSNLGIKIFFLLTIITSLKLHNNYLLRLLKQHQSNILSKRLCCKNKHKYDKIKDIYCK